MNNSFDGMVDPRRYLIRVEQDSKSKLIGVHETRFFVAFFTKLVVCTSNGLLTYRFHSTGEELAFFVSDVFDFKFSDRN